MSTLRPSHDGGFTLIELMIALIISVVVITAGFTILTSTSRAVRANDISADVQQNVRVAMELIARDVKLAGFGTSGAVGNCSLALKPTDATATGPDSGSDSMDLLVPTTSMNTPAWQLASVAGPNGFNGITLTAGARADMVSRGLVNNSYLSIGGAYTVKVPAVPAAGDTLTLESTVPSPITFPVGAQVHLLECIRYDIGTTAAACGSANAPCLRRGVSGGAMAAVVDGIEDLQLAYACDGCTELENGIIDNQIGGTAAFDSADFVSNSTWATSPMTADKIRLAQINLVSRQTATDLGFGEGKGSIKGSSASLVVSSDHTLAGDQQFRRRVLSKTVSLRNVGL